MKYLIAGPCSVESEEQIYETAQAVKAAGATMLRGGTFKPRTSPYTFQGLGKEGIELLLAAGKNAGLPTVTEILDVRDLELYRDVDVLQVGARNMQNYPLLKELGKSDKPVILKRGLSATIEEWLMSAEHIKAAGGKDIILCERGLRSFDPKTRFLLDISAVPVIKSQTDYPVIVDPSHAAGSFELVKPLALAACAAGADGLMIEVHPDPQKALSDGAQSLSPENFRKLAKQLSEIEPYANRY